jgi:hypothetical protein
MASVDGIESRGWLDWWANPWHLLGSVDVAVVISASGADWGARGRLISDEDKEREGFAFLCGVDPVFALRFEDGSTVWVTVHPSNDHGQFTLTEYTGPAGRAVDYCIDL